MVRNKKWQHHTHRDLKKVDRDHVESNISRFTSDFEDLKFCLWSISGLLPLWIYLFFLNLLVQQANQGWEISFVDQMSVSGKLFFTAIFKPKSYLSNERLLSLENGSRVAFTRIWSLKLANNLAYNVIMMIDERPKYYACP